MPRSRNSDGGPIVRLRARSLLALLTVAVFVGLAGVAAAAAPVKGGHYTGTVGPGYPMSFKVSSSGKDVDHLVVSFESTCQAGAGSIAPKFHFPTLKINKGHFDGTSTDHFGKNDSVRIKITGHIDGHKASGKVKSTSKIKSLGSCTQTEPFTAKT
jgi:hypothetical protein